MAEEKDKTGNGPEVEERLSARERVMKEIVEHRKVQADAEAAESFPVTDDDGNIVTPGKEPSPSEEGEEKELSLEEAAAQANAAADEEEPSGTSSSSSVPGSDTPPAAPTFDPNAEYELEVEGNKIKVLGSKILERGKATLQKETAAEYKLQMASELLEEAKRRAQALPQGGPTPAPQAPTAPAATEVDDATLAQHIQFGTPEQAAEAIKKLRQRDTQINPQQVMQFVTRNLPQMVSSQIDFENAVKMVKEEYSDLLANDYLRRLFYVEETRRRTPKDRGGEGDNRPHSQLYRSIGDDLRKAFNLKPPAKSTPAQAPAQTLAEKRAAKEATPVVPTPASARLDKAPAAKPATTADVINKMRSARHQRPL